MIGQKVTAIHFRGKNHIDGIWATKDINCHAERFLPLWSGIGDHRACVVDVIYEALIGEPILKIPLLKGIFTVLNIRG